MRFLSIIFSMCVLVSAGCDSTIPVSDIPDVPNVSTADISDAQAQTGGIVDVIHFDQLAINPTAPNAADEKVAKKRFEELNSTLAADLESLKAKIAKTSSDQEKTAMFADENPVPKFIDNMLLLSRDFHKTQTGVDAALAAFTHCNEPEKSQVMNFVLENYSAKLNYVAMISAFQADVPSPHIENWLAKMIEEAPEGEIKARAMMGYAKYVRQLPAFKTAFMKNPVLLARLPDDQQDYLRATRTDEEIAELEVILQTVINDYSDINYLGKRSFADVAESELFELQKLAVGAIAPEIVGKDFDGIDFKLSDYRGKVVMLDFWGHWCPPCRAMYPHEQELVKELGSQPFVLIGMNSDRSLDVARRSVRDEGLTWRNFWNGPKGTNGPIAQQWNVEAWPTVYLIDAKGVIRHKGILGEDIDRALEDLLAEMGHPVKIDVAH